MFFHPQHMQSLSRHINARVGLAGRAASKHPYWWGTQDIELAIEDEDGWHVVVNYLEVYLSNGRSGRLRWRHGEAYIEAFSRPFSLKTGQRELASGWVSAELWMLRKTLVDKDNPLRPFRKKRDDVKNDNDGKVEQEVFFKIPQVDILFEADDENYHIRQVALIIPSEENSDTPTFDPNFAPEYSSVFGQFGRELIAETRGVFRELTKAAERLEKNTSRETLEEQSFAGLDARLEAPRYRSFSRSSKTTLSCVRENASLRCLSGIG